MPQQVVLVTGCSEGGIGYELCKQFSRAGCKVFASARRLEAMRGLKELGIETMQLDVTSADSRRQAVQHVISAAGGVDVLVNNAGIGQAGPIIETELEAVKAIFETNLFGLLGMAQEVAPHMARNGSGKIVNIGSVVGYIPVPWGGAYAASKAAVHSLTDTMRLELGPLGIRVVLVAPGAVMSNIGANNAKRLSLRRDTMYGDYVKAIEERATVSQTPKSTPTAVFAARTVRAVLRSSPPRHFIFGHLSRLFRFFRRMPLWLVDRVLTRRFDLRRPAAGAA